jgi:hypothetical protein
MKACLPERRRPICIPLPQRHDPDAAFSLAFFHQEPVQSPKGIFISPIYYHMRLYT